MHPSRRNTSGPWEPTNPKSKIPFYQESPPIEWLRIAGAGGAIFIGKVTKIAAIASQYALEKSTPTLGYASYTLPPGYLLTLADMIFVFEAEDDLRLRQVAWCCAQRRALEKLTRVFVYSSCAEPKRAELEEKVRKFGAEFFPEFE
jgi:hypothetical protein